MNDHDAILAIQELLDGVEWTHETLEQLAEIMRNAGYRIRDLDDNDASDGFERLAKSIESIPTNPSQTAADAYAAWLANQPKPKTMAEALAQLPPGVTGVMMDPDKPEIVHNAIAEAVGERYHQLPPSQTINQEGEWK